MIYIYMIVYIYVRIYVCVFVLAKVFVCFSGLVRTEAPSGISVPKNNLSSPLRWAVSLAGDLGKNLWRVPSGPEKVGWWDLKCVIRNV